MSCTKGWHVLGVPWDNGAPCEGSAMHSAWWRTLGHAILQTEPSTVFEKLDTGHLSTANEAEAVRGLADMLAVRCASVAHDDRLPFVIGGDHSVSVGPIHFARQLAESNKRKLAIIWIDSHPDYHTCESSLSKNLHGVALAASLGDEPTLRMFALPPVSLPRKAVVLIGCECIDDPEQDRLEEHGVTLFSREEISCDDVNSHFRSLCNHLRDEHYMVYLSIDLDVLDSHGFPGVNTPCPGGIESSTLLAYVELIASHLDIVAADIVEYNYHNDVSGVTLSAVCSVIKHIIMHTYKEGGLHDSR